MRALLYVGIALALLACCAVPVAVVHLRRAPLERLDAAWPPPATAYSSAFADALWAKLERAVPMAVDRDQSTLGAYLQGARGDGGRTSLGALMCSVAATSVLSAQEASSSGHVARLVALIAVGDALRERASPDDLAALYAETIHLLPGSGGFTWTSQQVFGKPAALLDAIEAATLLELAWSTNRCDLERVLMRRNELVARMERLGLAPSGAGEQARGATLGPSPMVLGALCIP